MLNTDKDALYKDRTPRNEVMDAVYDDFDFAMKNVRLDDGDAQYVNRYVVAAFVSRWALFEASWQKYYYKNDERHPSLHFSEYDPYTRHPYPYSTPLYRNKGHHQKH